MVQTWHVAELCDTPIVIKARLVPTGTCMGRHINTASPRYNSDNIRGRLTCLSHHSVASLPCPPGRCIQPTIPANLRCEGNPFDSPIKVIASSVPTTTSILELNNLTFSPPQTFCSNNGRNSKTSSTGRCEVLLAPPIHQSALACVSCPHVFKDPLTCVDRVKRTSTRYKVAWTIPPELKDKMTWAFWGVGGRWRRTALPVRWQVRTSAEPAKRWERFACDPEEGLSSETGLSVEEADGSIIGHCISHRRRPSERSMKATNTSSDLTTKGSMRRGSWKRSTLRQAYS